VDKQNPILNITTQGSIFKEKRKSGSGGGERKRLTLAKQRE
jgi:hypothetical protein